MRLLTFFRCGRCAFRAGTAFLFILALLWPSTPSTPAQAPTPAQLTISTAPSATPPPVDDAIIHYAAMRALDTTISLPTSAKVTPIPAADVRVELRLDKPAYNLGEPIFATLVVTNVSSRSLEISTGGDYRSGRS